MTDPVLAVEGLSVTIEVPAGRLHAVTDVSFSVAAGETLCLVGESGCGKTTTALALMRLLPRKTALAARAIRFDGRDLSVLDEKQMAGLRGDRMAMVFQDPMTALNPVYTIGNQLVEVYLRHGKGGRREARERACFLLDRVGVSAPATRLAQYPHELSGGLRQRMMIAMALMCGPSLIIADEPTTALDVTVQVQILALLRRLQDEFRTALILITHNLGVVARVADRVAVMYGGRIVEEGTAAALFAAPRHPYTRGLLACMPVPGRIAHGERLGAIPGLVPSLIGPQRGCGFHNRCGESTPDCLAEGVPLHALDADRAVRCLRA